MLHNTTISIVTTYDIPRREKLRPQPCRIYASQSLTMPKPMEEEDSPVENDKGSKLSSAWYWYKKVTSLPSDMGKYQASGKAAYLLMTAVAVYMVVIITMDDSVYTDVNELPDHDHVLPDVVMCPYPTSEHLRTETTDITNTSVRDPYNRKFFVWYLRQEVEALDMKDDELDALATYFRNSVRPTNKMMNVLNGRVRTMLTLLVKRPDWHQSALVSNLYRTTNITDDLEALWLFLAVPPLIDKVNVKQLKCWPNQEGTVDYDWCKRVAEPVWIGNQYCVLFPFQTRKVSMWSHQWNIKHYIFSWTENVPKLYSEGLGVKVWLGNFQLQKVNADNMWTLYPNEKDCYAYLDYDAFKVSDQLHPRQTVCQENVVFINDSQFSTCRPEPIGEYWMFKFGLNRGCDLSPWFFSKKITHTTVRSSFTAVQRIQLYGGVFGFTTGFSLLQLFELFTKLVGRRIKNSIIRTSELVIMLLMTAFSTWFAIDNLQELASNSRFVRTNEYNSLSTQPILPHLALSRGNLQPMTLLNHSRLAEYNVSLRMLQYITGLSGTSVYSSYFYTTYFLTDSKNDEMNTTTREKLKELGLMNMDMSGNFLVNSSHTNGLFVSQMETQFQDLQTRMGFDSSAPPIRVYEQFRVDLCQLIKQCVYKQKTIIPDCCQHAQYETHQYHRWSDAITIRFTDQFQLDTSGDTNGIDIYLDAGIFREANYEYLGPEHIDFVRAIEFTRVGLRFNLLSLLLYDGNEDEQQSFGFTEIQLGSFESAGMFQNAGFTITRTSRLEANTENNCRPQNADCRAMSHGNLATSFLARALAEKTMCKCNVCHSTAPNRVIQKLWDQNGCCTAKEATQCYNQPIKCCQNGVECCFDPIKNLNQTCNSGGTLIQTLLYNREAESEAKCSIEYEVADPRAAESGSIVAKQLSAQDRQEFENYIKNCKKIVCDRRTISPHRIDTVQNTNLETNSWFGLRVYIVSDEILSSIETDRFSVLEAAVQFVSGFGLLFGLSMMTVFEMFSAAFDSIRAKLRPKVNSKTTDANHSFQSLCRQVIIERAMRSVDVFSTNEQKAEIGQQDQPKESDEQPKNKKDKNRRQTTGKCPKNLYSADDETKSAEQEDESNHLISDTHAVLCLIIGTMLAGYSLYLLIQMFTQNGAESNYEVSFNGTLSPPSIAFCVQTEKDAEMIELLTFAECSHQEKNRQPCVNYFNIVMNIDNKTCLINNFTDETRTYNVDKRRFTDFKIRFKKNVNNLTSLLLWFGYLPSVRNGQLNPLEPWTLSKSTNVRYKLMKSKQVNCESKQFIKSCLVCEQEQTSTTLQNSSVCCLKDGQKQVADLLRDQDPLPPCVHDYFTVEMKETDEQNEDWIEVKLIDYYGVVELRQISVRHSWSFVLSNLGTVIDTFVGVTFLNVVCVLIVCAIMLMDTVYALIKSIYYYALYYCKQ